MIDIFDSPGLIGGIAGLLLGLVDWVLFTSLIEPRVEAARRAGALKGARGRATSLRALRAAFLLSCFVALPVVGYFVGRVVLPGFGIGTGG